MKTRIWMEGYRTGEAFPEKWKKICQERKKKRELVLRPAIREEKHAGSIDKMKEQEIIERQNKAGGTKDPSTIQVMIKEGKLDLKVGVILTLVSCAFFVFTWQPFQTKWIAYLLSIGFVGATIYCIHLALKSYFESRWLLFGISALCVAFAIFGHVLISLIRGQLFKELYGSSNVGFYSAAVNLLAIALPFMCLALEIGAGIALFSANEKLWSTNVRDYNDLKKYRKRMIEADSDIERLKNIPEIEELEFTEGAMEGERKALARREKRDVEKKLAWIVPLAILIILFLGLFAGKAFGYETENITVVALDLSKSTLSKDGEGETEFEKNLRGVEDVLKNVQPSTRVVVIGITASSFSTPRIFLDIEIPRKPGFFKEKLKEAREKLSSEWQEKSSQLRADHVKSDLFGAIALASHLTNGKSNARLIMFSDLRHNAGRFDLESPSRLDHETLLSEAEKQGFIVSLKGVEIFCFGVHGAGKSFVYWESLRKFWEGFFEKSQGKLKTYSILRRINHD